MANFRGPFIVFVMSVIGFLLALVAQMAYDSGYLITSYVTSAAQLQGLEILIIIMAMLVGAVLAAATQ